MVIRTLEMQDILSQKESILIFLKEIYHENFLLDIEPEEVAVQKYEELKKYCEDGSAILLGVLDGKELIAFLWAYRREVFGKPRIHLAQICVGKGYRQRGIGSQLLRKLEGILEGEAANVIELMATYDNELLIRFYQENGFEMERVLMVKKS